MKDSITIDAREFISVGRAAEITKYTKDYVGQLCRGGKVAARMVGRTWFIDRESLTLYKNSADTFFSGYGKQKDMVVPSAVVPASQPAVVATQVPVVSIDSSVSVSDVTPVAAPSSVTSPITYVVDARPLMPVLSKQVPQEARQVHFKHTLTKSQAKAQVHIEQREAEQAQVVSVIRSRTRGMSTANLSFMRTSLVALAIVVALSSGSAAIYHAYSTNNPSTLAVTSPADVVADTASVAGFFGSVSDFVKGIFGIKSQTLATIVDKPPPKYGGIAVVPAADDQAHNDLIKQKIQSSFSDEVEVVPDESGTAGVVTPVFKKAKGDSFVYVLVPVEDKQGDQVE